MVGSWKPVRTENYSQYLKEVVGLGMMVRKIAEKIPLTPTFTIVDGELCCQVSCPGAAPVCSKLVAGHSTFYEPNSKVTFVCDGTWEDDPPAFRAERHCEEGKVLKGGTITAYNEVTEQDQLIITQFWGDGNRFVSTHVRCGSVRV